MYHSRQDRNLMHVYISSYLHIRTIQMHLFDNKSSSSSLFVFPFRKKGGKKWKIPHDRLPNVYHADRVNIMLILSRISPVMVIDDSSSLPPAFCLPPRCGIRYGNRSRPKIIVIDSHTSRFRYASYVSESLVAVAATRGMIPLAKPGSLLGSLTMLWRINVITRYAATPLLARVSW